MPFRPEIKRIIEAELGRPISDVFSELDEKPLASGSIAQVHSAVLRDSGKRVVLKVLKPGVEEILSTDMDFLYLLSRYLALVAPEVSRLSLTEIMSDIRYSMVQEVDFNKEVEHISTFSSYLDSQNLRSIATCPYVYKQLSSRRLIVMEKLEGVPLTDLSSIRAVTRKDPEGVLVSALNTWFGSVLAAETFHADVHAGNLLVLNDGRVGFLDFGIVGRISPVTFKAIEALVTSVAVGDYETMARALATIGATDADVDFKSFARDLEAFFAELEAVNSRIVIENNDSQGGGGISAAVEVDQNQLNRLFVSLVRIGEKQGIRFPREFGLFLKQILYFDRYTKILAPSLQVFNDERINVRGMSKRYGVGQSIRS